MRMSSVLSLTRCWMLFCYLCCFIKITQAANTCPLPTNGSSGDGTEVTLRIYKCHQGSASSPNRCGSLQKEIKLKRGATTSLEYSPQGYLVIGKYLGKEVCVSWRRLDRTLTSFIGTQRDESCKASCFTDTEYATYLMDGSCTNQGCWWQFNSLKFQVILPERGYGNKCPITEQGKSGNEERAQVDVWNCIRSTRGSDACGGKAVRSGVLLRRGVVTNLGYDVNDYAVMAKFFGNEVCVSYRSYTRSSDVSKCNEKCFSIYEDGGEEKETYRTKITCSSISCGGSIETLKFVATAKGRIVQYAPLLLILAPLFVLKLIA